MELDKKILKLILVDGGYIEPAVWQEAEKTTQTKRLNLLEYLFSKGVLTPDVFGQAMSEYFKVPYADLNSNMPAKEQILIIPEDIAKKFRIVIFKSTDKEVVICTDNPNNSDLKAKLKEVFTSLKIKLAYSLTEDIDKALLSYKKALNTRFAGILKESGRVAPEIVDEIFADAITYGTSDIHFEPYVEEVIVRFRIDGVLEEAGRLPKKFYENIVNRIKVKSHLRTDEHFAAQDGSMFYEKERVAADMRVSIVPVLDGEKIVIRLLAHYVRGFDLGDLGLMARDQKTLETAADKPFGMILVVGPTGSGKTTTLYAVVKKLNDADINITTIEDPVEYKIAGINQIQVNSLTNLTFAQGLKSIVRQDPDIIMVGEIRDEETVEISVNAALTGHLLLSTFHANDAATGIPRLLDMGAEAFLLSSTLELIMAQRLARRLCEHCRYSYSADISEIEEIFPQARLFFKQKKATLYKSKGCANCHDTGYSGRVALFEMIKITPEMRELILSRPSAAQIWQLAKKQGSRSMFEDGIDKVGLGITALDEILRVAPVPDIVINTSKMKAYGTK